MLGGLTGRVRPRTILFAISLPAILGVSALAGGFGGGDQPASASANGPMLVAPGVVEPISEEIQIAADVPGILGSVNVDEGDPITKGQVLAEIVNGDLKAALAEAQAVVLRRQAELDRLRNGSREEERQQAEAQVAEAAASEDQARRDLARKAPLAADGVESQSALDQAAAAAARAEARRRALSAQRALVNAEARPEDIRIAEAALAEAQANVAQIDAQIDKTIFRSPIDGVVLAREKRAGEAVTNIPPTVILRIGDISRLRVRADVDEADVAKVAVGQRVAVTADAYSGRRFGGRIVRVGASLGRKNFRTDRPTERVDTKILETLIELDSDVRIPVGLRVDVWDAGSDAVTAAESPVTLAVPDPISPITAVAVTTPAIATAEIAEISDVAAAEAMPDPLQTVAGSDEPHPASEIAPPRAETGPALAVAADAPPPPAAPGPTRSRIVLRAVADSWIQVRDGNGRSVVNRLLKTGEVYDVPDQSGLVLMAGNAGGLDVLVDGSAIPRLGKPSRVVRDVALDPDRLVARQVSAN